MHRKILLFKKTDLTKYNILLTILFALLNSCQTMPTYTTPANKIKAEIKQEFNPKKNYPITKIPSSINELLTPKIYSNEINGPTDDPIEKKFNITADNAPAKDFFLELVSGTNINIIIHPEVQGHISLALKNATIIEALEAVQKIHGFGFEISNNNIKIFPVTLQTKVFKLNYLDLTRSGNSGTNINFSGISSNNSQSNSTANNKSSNNNNNNNNNSSSNNNNANSNGSNVITYNSTNVWEQLLTTIQSIIGVNQESTKELTQNSNQSATANTSNYGLNTIKKNFDSLLKTGNNKNSSNNSMDAQSKRVAVSPTTGMIIVTAYPNELEKVAQFLEDAENSLNRQVMLEAKVLEIDLKDGYRTGINWSLLNEHMKISQIIGSSASGSEEDLSSDTKVNSYATNASKTVNLNVGNQHLAPDINTTVNSFGGLFTLGLNYRKLATFVELLSAQGNVQVLSSPRITTSNNQKALIKVGNDSYYITGFTPSTTTTNTGGTTTNQPSVNLSPLFSGIALDVTPQIGDDEITLHIHPTISNITTSATDIPGNTGKDAVKLAVNSIRESDSIVRAKNGQLIIIGGLMQDKTAEIVTGIPILKDLPILGNIFKHSRQQAAKSELVILLRPIILDDYKIKHQLKNTHKRISNLERNFNFEEKE